MFTKRLFDISLLGVALFTLTAPGEFPVPALADDAPGSPKPGRQTGQGLGAGRVTVHRAV